MADLRHAGLDTVANDFDFTEFRSAATTLGLSDPLAQLTKVDCDPTDIRLQVEDLSEHFASIRESFDEAEHVFNEVFAAWQEDHAPSEGFRRTVHEMRARFAAMQGRLADTETAGNQTAEDLDTLAKGVAREATWLVETTAQDVALVLYERHPDGTDPTDDELSQAKTVVRSAHAALKSTVESATDSLPQQEGPARLRGVKSAYEVN